MLVPHVFIFLIWGKLGKMSQSTSCRLCNTPYKDPKSTSRSNIFVNKKDKNAETWEKILLEIGVKVKKVERSSDTICKPCQTQVLKTRSALKMVDKWNENDGNIEEAYRKRKVEEDLESRNKRLRLSLEQHCQPNLDFNLLEKLCSREIEKLERESSITKVSQDTLINMDDKKLCEEYDSYCPVLCSVIKAAIGRNTILPRLIVYGMLFKARYPNSRACILTHRNDQLLFASGAKKKIFSWFSKMAFSNSYTTALKRNATLAKDHDSELLRWKVERENAVREILKECPGASLAIIAEKLKEKNLVDVDFLGDNFDYELTAAHQSKENKNQSLHWFHYCAILNRILSSQDHRTKEFYENFEILPGPSSQEQLEDDFKILIARSIVAFLPAFKEFEPLVTKHIPHPFQNEMSQKSTVIPLGLIFKSENVSAEMAEILMEIQKYVPKVYDEKGEVLNVAEEIPLGGDQLTEERAANCQNGFMDGQSEIEQIKGISTKFEDWHFKKTLYEIKHEIFYKENSGNQHGTTLWAMNVLYASNAKKGPHKAFNAYKEFTDKELDALIVTAAMAHFEMKKFDEDPVPKTIKFGSRIEKLRWLYKNIKQIIDKFTVSFSVQEEEHNQKEQINRCTVCQKEYKYHKAMLNHEKKMHDFERPEEQPIKVTQKIGNSDENTDHVNLYAKALLTFDLYLRNINDCIREGDGERLINTYRFALLYFKCFGHSKYAYTTLKLFHKIKLQPENAFRLIWGRFVNTSGVRGRNVSRDLHLEHLNNFLKELLKSLRSNLNTSNAKRISESIRNLKRIIENLEKALDIESKPRGNKDCDVSKDVFRLSDLYQEKKVFCQINGREHDSFPEFKEDILKDLDLKTTFKWLKAKAAEFKEVFKSNT